MNRRHFLKFASASALVSGVGVANVAHAEAQNKPPIAGSVGMLYDSTLCIGCQACVAKCQQLNQSVASGEGQPTWSNNDKLSPYTKNIIQIWRDGSGVHKDMPSDGYAYIKKQCMHCVDPNCVSVCPVQALRKDPKTGIVHYDPDVCTGCRYCMVGCPFDVPKYEYNNPFGAIHKCELCNQKGLARIDQGLMPGCVEVCPTGAVIYGTREELLAEAKRRLLAPPGSQYAYPRQTLQANDPHWREVASYQPYVYGEKEGGGTQVLVLAGVPYKNLDMPNLPELSSGARSEHIQHTLYKGMVLPMVVLTGLSVLIRRNTKHDPHHHGDEPNHAGQQGGKDHE